MGTTANDRPAPSDQRRGADEADRVLCLLEVSRHLVASFDLEAILQATTEAVVRLAGLDTAAVYLVDGQRLRLWATTPPLPPGFPEELRDAPIEDHPHLRAAVETRAPSTLPDMPMAELSPAERAVASARNLRTVLFIPLVVGGTSTGSLIVGSVGEPRHVAKADIDLCFTLGNLAALAVENARLFHASQTHVAELQRTLADRERTERERLELQRQLLHAQRLESLGVLAGGIAHDFNNLLLAIQANVELALRKLPATAAGRGEIEHCAIATRRAADLTRQMLAYSGKGRFAVEPVDLEALLRENIGLFRSSVARAIDLELALDESLPSIDADPGQLQQMVMNLITNAAEAIGDKPGVITIRASIRERDDAELARSLTTDVSPARRFVCLELSDTGCGMSLATRQRLFDPFFSTKGAGRGLGMAALLGIVRAHRGAIFVDSELGAGTTIRVLLPVDSERRADEHGQQPGVAAAGDAPTMTGTVLVADDEEMVLGVCKGILEDAGLHVLTAADGREAIEVFRRHADDIRCVILDQTMPNVDGFSAFREIAAIKPEVPVLLSSGFAARDLATGPGPAFAGFLQKPYTIDQLLETLRRALER